MNQAAQTITALARAVADYDLTAAGELTAQALTEGAAPLEILEQGLAQGMAEVSDRYGRGRYFVPELLLASDAFGVGLAALEPALPQGAAGAKGCLVLGTVEGDIHQIGKDLVGLMFRASGWQVHDLGPSVPAESFAQACRLHKPDLVGLSALMTTSLELMPGIVRAVKTVDPAIGVIIGGASVSGATAARVGADGFAADASAAVKEADRVRQALR